MNDEHLMTIWADDDNLGNSCWVPSGSGHLGPIDLGLIWAPTQRTTNNNLFRTWAPGQLGNWVHPELGTAGELGELGHLGTWELGTNWVQLTG